MCFFVMSVDHSTLDVNVRYVAEWIQNSDFDQIYSTCPITNVNVRLARAEPGNCILNIVFAKAK
jgi:hypothetical protein